MPTAFQIGDKAREDSCNAIVDLLDAGAGAASLYIFTGAAPANCAAADSGTLLATLSCTDPAFGNSNSTGTANANTIASATAVASGAAGHWRWKDSNGVVRMQGSAGEAADTPDMVFNDKDVVLGGNVSCSAAQVNMPAS